MILHRADDMLAILFPHMFEELEYLLPDADDVLANIWDGTVNGSESVAGPSSIRR